MISSAIESSKSRPCYGLRNDPFEEDALRSLLSKSFLTFVDCELLVNLAMSSSTMDSSLGTESEKSAEYSSSIAESVLGCFLPLCTLFYRLYYALSRELLFSDFNRPLALS